MGCTTSTDARVRSVTVNSVEPLKTANGTNTVSLLHENEDVLDIENKELEKELDLDKSDVEELRDHLDDPLMRHEEEIGHADAGDANNLINNQESVLGNKEYEIEKIDTIPLDNPTGDINSGNSDKEVQRIESDLVVRDAESVQESKKEYWVSLKSIPCLRLKKQFGVRLKRRSCFYWQEISKPFLKKNFHKSLLENRRLE